MGLLYADALGGYTDPASSGLKHMRADGQWANPDAAYRFLDATGSWSVPELEPNVGRMSWSELAEFADLAAKNPEGYMQYVGEERTFKLGGSTVVARVAGIGQDKLRNGGNCGITFHVYRGLENHAMKTSAYDAAGGYASTDMRTYLEGLKFPDEAEPFLQEFEVRYRDGTDTSLPAHSIYSKIAIMSLANLYTADSQGIKNGGRYIYDDEGPIYQYFEMNDTAEVRRHSHYPSSDSWGYAWLLTPTNANRFCYIVRDGSVYSGDGSTQKYIPSVRFCMGSSI